MRISYTLFLILLTTTAIHAGKKKKKKAAQTAIEQISSTSSSSSSSSSFASLAEDELPVTKRSKQNKCMRQHVDEHGPSLPLGFLIYMAALITLGAGVYLSDLYKRLSNECPDMEYPLLPFNLNQTLSFLRNNSNEY